MLKIIFLFTVKILVQEDFLYHAHSFNSIPLMKQQMIKGTRSFKIDVSLNEINSCKKYSKNQDYSITEIYFDEIMGCLALRGDNSQSPYLIEPFYTTEDLLQFFQSDFLQKILYRTSSELFIELSIQENGLSFKRHLYLDFVIKLIDVLDKVGGINVVSKECFQLQMQHICQKQYDGCFYNKMAQKIITNDNLICLNSLLFGGYQTVLNIQYLDLEKQCQFGFDHFLSSPHPIQIWEPNNEQTIVNVYNYIKNYCPKIQDHPVKITSNIDIDTFRKNYYFNFRQEEQKGELLYDFIPKLKDEQFIDSHHIYNPYAHLISIYKDSNKQNKTILKIHSLHNRNFMELMQTIELNDEIIQMTVQNKILAILYDKKENNLVFYYLDEQSQLQESLKQNCLHDKIIFYDSFKDYKYYGFSNKKQQQKFLVEMNDQEIIEIPYPEEISFEDYDVQLYQDQFYFNFNLQHYNNIQNIQLSYFMFYNYKTQKWSSYQKYIGKIESFSFYKDNFMILLNNSQLHYGSSILNNNGKEYCLNYHEYYQSKRQIPNTKYLLNYYYGQLNWFENNKNKEITICEEDIIHGNLGTSKRAKVDLLNFRIREIAVIIQDNVPISDLDTFYTLFGGLQQNENQENLLIYEIPLDQFIKL